MPHFETIVDRVFLYLLFTSLDPNSVVEYEGEASCDALEIAAMNRNEPAFNLLAPHCDDELKKKMARLVLIGSIRADLCYILIYKQMLEKVFC